MDNTYTVKNLSEYIEVLENFHLFNYISRGENKKYDSRLSSGIQRRKLYQYQDILDSYHLEVESSIVQLQEKHFLAFAQHHGIPTNLLDFSKSPLVSLYFATDRCDETGYVYFLNNTKLINISKIILKKDIGWGLLDDFLSFDSDVIPLLYPQMTNSFMANREAMITFFEEHTETFIENFKKRRSKAYLDTIVGVSDLEKALIKYKEDRVEWISNGVDSREITLQIKDSVPNLLKGFEQIYKGNICYPSDFFQGYSQLNNIKSARFRYSANIDLMLFLLKMEIIENRNANIEKNDALTSDIYYELVFPFYYLYQPPVIDERVKNQSSVFVFQPFSGNINPYNGNIEQVWQKIVPDFVIEIQNPKEIKKELDYLGINEKHIYCDYDHVAQYVISKF